jgi:hypothetical protein
MNTVNSLLEGASPYQVLQEQAGKLAGKWDRSGLLEGIESSTERNNMSMLLENQAKQLVNEANTVSNQSTSFSAGTGEAWAGVALPLVRRVFGEIVAKDLVSVQPMNLPAGLIFYLDFQYGQETGGKAANESLYGATSDLKRTDGNFNTGLYGAGEFGYSVKTGSITAQDLAAAGAVTTTSVYATGSATFNGILNMDTEFSASQAGKFGSNDTTGATSAVRVLKINTSSVGLSDADHESIRSWTISTTLTKPVLFPQFTRINEGNFEFVISASHQTGAQAQDLGNVTLHYTKGPDNLNDRSDFEDSSMSNDAVSSLNIPEINVQMRSDTVAAKTRKLKAQWTPEFAQDLNAYHSIDAEAELTSILSEYISMEIDLEILDMLIRNADTVEGWSAAVAKDVTVSTNNVGGDNIPVTFSSTVNDAGVYYTKMSWFQTLGIKLQKVSNLIHQKTLRGGANWMVVSPKVSTLLESIPGFAADSSGDSDKYNMGVQKIGAIDSRYTVYKNPYMTENIILMGYKGSQFLETGAVFAPYIPLIMTPLVYDPISFTPRKGIMTRYAKKMVRPDFYGKVYIQDLNEL